MSKPFAERVEGAIANYICIRGWEEQDRDLFLLHRRHLIASSKIAPRGQGSPRSFGTVVRGSSLRYRLTKASGGGVGGFSIAGPNPS